MLRIATTAVGLVALAASASAGPERVDYPAGYANSFKLYATIDRPDREVVWFMYVDPATDAVARAGESLPFGAVLVMEDHRAQLDAAEAPARADDGRMIPTDTITNVFVMEKGGGRATRRSCVTAIGSTRGSCPTAAASRTRALQGASPATPSVRRRTSTFPLPTFSRRTRGSIGPAGWGRHELAHAQAGVVAGM